MSTIPFHGATEILLADMVFEEHRLTIAKAQTVHGVPTFDTSHGVCPLKVIQDFTHDSFRQHFLFLSGVTGEECLQRKRKEEDAENCTKHLAEGMN